MIPDLRETGHGAYLTMSPPTCDHAVLRKLEQQRMTPERGPLARTGTLSTVGMTRAVDSPATGLPMAHMIKNYRRVHRVDLSEGRFRRMTGFPWTTLITVAGPLAGALGAVELKGRQDAKKRKMQAARADQAADDDRRRQAYADLLVAARLVLRNCRQLRVAYATGMFTDPVAKEAFDSVGKLSQDMTMALAVVQTVDSDQPRVCAEAIYDAAGAVMDIFSRRTLALRGFGAGDEPLAFDIEAAESTIERLNDTIKMFVDSTHTRTATS